jgi:uncharacterized protein YidB (DUF937 family)
LWGTFGSFQNFTKVSQVLSSNETGKAPDKQVAEVVVSLLDLIGGVLGQQQQQQGTSSGIVQALTQLVAGQGDGPAPGNNTGQAGGLTSLIEQFRQSGLGHIADSWIGTGPNQPISPHQLEHVFGGQQVDTMAEQSGMDRGQFLSQLSQALPSVVDRMTPNGRVSEEGTISV